MQYRSVESNVIPLPPLSKTNISLRTLIRTGINHDTIGR